MTDVQTKIKNLVDNFHVVFKSEWSKESFVKMLTQLVEKRVQKEVKIALHKERSSKASAEYKNKAGQAQ
jgi:hypothetical protein